MAKKSSASWLAALWSSDLVFEANFAMLDYGARFGDDLLMSMYTMASRAVKHGREDHWTVTPRLVAEAERRDDDTVFSDPLWRDPRAYVLPADQRDWSAATRLARTLWRGGVDMAVDLRRRAWRLWTR